MVRLILKSLSAAALAAIAVLAALVSAEAGTIATAQPAAPLETSLHYVPTDAAAFIHVDASRVWNGPLVKSIRGADPKFLDEIGAGADAMFGSKLDSLGSITLFWPKIKGPQEAAQFGVVLAFKTPYHKAKLKAGFEKLVEPRTKVTLVEVSPQLVVLLAGLDPAAYGKPQAGGKGGNLEDAIREASTGRHLLSIGVSPGNLPDEIRREDLPAEVRAFQPLFHADSVALTIDLDKELVVNILVKSPTPPRAKEAEKALGFLATLAGDTLGQGIKELSKDSKTEPELKDLVAILTALQTSVKDAKFSTDGEVTRVTAKTSGDLPLASAFLAAKRKTQEAAARAQSSNNLKQIALAMHNYESGNGTLPPAAVCDKTGKPVLSWRVLILPYIEEENLYKQFKLDEPWDSENNKKLIAKMPKIYGLPGVPGVKANETHYRLFVGNGAAFDYLKGNKFTDITDGTSNTIMAATAKDSVIWSKPDELDFDPDKDMTKLLGFYHGNVCGVAFCDGSVRAFSKSLGKVSLKAYITMSGAEVVSDDE